MDRNLRPRPDPVLLILVTLVAILTMAVVALHYRLI